MCGGSSAGLRIVRWLPGLSPRVRGKRAKPTGRGNCNGSIPACAGEARSWVSGFALAQVYPRVCGGSVCELNDARNAVGLSPRVRGKHDFVPGKQVVARSIPACAGEAPSPPPPLPVPGVYPRVCGGSVVLAGSPVVWPGLSPRVRGKPKVAEVIGEGTRSIPACAGEAEWVDYLPPDYPVYPRVCGGSSVLAVLVMSANGLSPRVRGKPHPLDEVFGRRWSIPACAGEAAGGQG